MVKTGHLGRAGCVLLACFLGWGLPATARAQDPAFDFRGMLEKQRQQIEEQSRQLQELKERLDAVSATKVVPPEAAAAGDGKADPTAIDKYLKDHPGAGMPTGVQMGYTPNGFF